MRRSDTNHAPNVLFVLTDQWPATRFSHRGSPVQTPNVDALAAHGTVFTNAFTTCPLCTPARGTLLSGRWPWRTGVIDNYGIGYSTQEPMATSIHTWIDAAARSGFEVGYFGKWHLGPDGPALHGAHASTHGIDAGKSPYDGKNESHSYQKALDQQARQKSRIIDGVPPFYGRLKGGKEAADTHRTTTETTAFIDRVAAASKERPFFLTASFNGPHFPHYLPAEYAALYDPADVTPPASLHDSFERKPWFHSKPWWPSMDTSWMDEEAWRKAIAFTWGHMTMVDHAIGTILGALQRHGLSDKTVVVFTADHGDMCGEHSRFDKGPYFYDEVMNIPLVIGYPGKQPAVQPGFASLLDVGATLFGLAGDHDHIGMTDGRDLLPAVGVSTPVGPDEAFGAYQRYNGMSFEVRCLRTERHKLVWNPQAVDELYDLTVDPAELHNRIDDPELAGVQSDMMTRLLRFFAERGDKLAADRPTDLPAAGTIILTGKDGP